MQNYWHIDILLLCWVPFSALNYCYMLLLFWLDHSSMLSCYALSNLFTTHNVSIFFFFFLLWHYCLMMKKFSHTHFIIDMSVNSLITLAVKTGHFKCVFGYTISNCHTQYLWLVKNPYVFVLIYCLSWNRIMLVYL